MNPSRRFPDHDDAAPPGAAMGEAGGWWVALALCAAAATAAGCASALGGPPAFSPRACPPGIAGSFLQLAESDLRRDRTGWDGEMAFFGAVGVTELVVQFTGDAHGPYDRQYPHTMPVRSVVHSAAAAGIKVWLGLHADPRWPANTTTDRDISLAAGAPPPVAPPLDDVAAVGELVALCVQTRLCQGFYLSSEIDDHGGIADSPRVMAYLRAAQVLRRLAPDKRISLAPFFTTMLSPDEHAQFWQPMLAAHLFDVLMLQDGVGVGRASSATARLYLEALRRVLPPTPLVGGTASIQLWAVVELFRQVSGPPIDDRAFSARPAPFQQVERSLAEEGGVADKMIGFSAPDYMDPRRSRDARRLYLGYRDWCEARSVAPQISTTRGKPS